MNASALNRLSGLISVMSLSARIKEAMGDRSNAEFAKAAGVSPAAVTHWLSGNTKSLKADVAARLEAVTGFKAVWIATGKGPPKDGALPKGDVFRQPTQEEWKLLDDFRVLLDEDRERYALEIARQADKMRAYQAQIMRRIAPPTP